MILTLNCLFFSEPSCKTAPVNDTEGLNLLESKIYDFLNLGLNLVHNRFLPFRNKYSPKVSFIQSNIDYHPDNNHVEKEVEMKGCLNCHLYLNAKTQMKYTEPDACYTAIIVLNQIVNKGVINAHAKVGSNSLSMKTAP